ncbi:hypothetical protein EJ03DRAFT_178933 [Teratosphaeria nubilosa]|uniref:Uncharacterized protein n=1 Tax=Teratosphaeria nubilosa TaxID=161662 RepID=A0A6G1L146_9PEZI|nr:hypothetical protein EJ03DRAFT_178933 [Teratosphaeria nubilosa]
MPASGSKLDDYCRLGTYGSWTATQLRSHLASVGYDVPKSTTKKDLVAMMQSKDCGPMCYDQCTHKELVKFAASRRIDISATKETTTNRRRIIRTLVQADVERTFDRFMDLPPELRSRVYDYYLLGFAKVLHLPSQPPFARVHPTLRSELLPKFYRSKTFRLDFERRKPTTKFTASLLTQLFLVHLRDEDVKEMRKFVLGMCIPDNRTFGDTFLTAKIKLYPSEAAYTLFLRQETSREDGIAGVENMKILRKETKKVLDSVAARPGTKQLKKQDFYDLSYAMKAACE